MVAQVYAQRRAGGGDGSRATARPDQENPHGPIRHPDGNGETMSPRTKSSEADAPQSEQATPRRRGRPRKSETAAVDAVESQETTAVTADDEPAAAEQAERPAAKRRGRPPKNRKPDAEHGEDGEAARDRQEGSRADDGAEASDQAGDGAEEPGRDNGRPARNQDQEGRDERRGRRGNRNQGRKGAVNFRDLQAKVLPELHLMAKEVGLEDYRQLEKDDLVVAVRERATEQEGLRLVKGYLEISSDGYGFLQESLLQNNTRSVIVSAGLIKQFRLRTGDLILGKARRPRDNERYGTLIRVE